jgi:hypothetical protein
MDSEALGLRMRPMEGVLVPRPSQAIPAATNELKFFLSRNSQEGAIAPSIEIGFLITFCTLQLILSLLIALVLIC